MTFCNHLNSKSCQFTELEKQSITFLSVKYKFLVKLKPLFLKVFKDREQSKRLVMLLTDVCVTAPLVIIADLHQA